MLSTLIKQYTLTKLRSFHSREQLKVWQNKKVLKHLNWVIANSPFYRDLYRGLDLCNWREFPHIEKKQMMDNFSLLNTCKISRENAFEIALAAEEDPSATSTINEITIGLSTGTSGNRGLFLVSPKERYRWAGSILAKTLPYSLLKKQSIAFFFRTTSPLYNSIQSKKIQFEYYHLQDSIEKHISRLNLYQPTLLISPPSMLRKLAEKKQRGALKIKPVKIISIAEVLDPLDEVYISSIFGQQVHQIYQATEGFLGTTCSHGTLHLNEDLMVIQKESIPGAEGRFYPIITDFNRFSQPIIQYRLNDILHEKKEPCPCGSVFTGIESIEGRSDDIFYIPSANGLKPIYPDFIRKAIVATDPQIEEYRVVQKGLHLIEVSLKISGREQDIVESKIKTRLIELFQKQQLESPKIEFACYNESCPTKKLRRIERSTHDGEHLQIFHPPMTGLLT
jgi:putative adenylate-forming enzyme